MSALSRDNLEHAGVLVKGPDGNYYATVPHCSTTPDEFAVKLKLDQGWSLAGIYHTHPGQDADAQYFSGHDVQTANAAKVPSYIRFNSDNSIRSYTPGATKVQQTRIDEGNMPTYEDTARGDPLPAQS
jgi:hypothetical protein